MKRFCLPALLLAGLLLILPGCSSVRTYSFEEMMKMESKGFKTGGKILMKDLDRYRIVYPDEANDEELALVYQLRDAIAAKTGITLETVSDLAEMNDDGIGIGKYEIILGDCLRPTINVFLDEYRTGAEGWNMVGNHLCICRTSYSYIDHQLKSVTEAFIANVVDSIQEGDKVFFDSETDAYLKKNSAAESLILNGQPITDYVIIPRGSDDPDRAADNYGVAKILQFRLADVCGDIIPIQSLTEENEDVPAIIVGVNALPDEQLQEKFDELFGRTPDDPERAEWSVHAVGSTVWLSGKVSFSVVRAVDTFLELLTPEQPVPVHEVQLDLQPVTGDLSESEEITMLYTDFGGEMHDSTAMERYAAVTDHDLLITGDMDGWLAWEARLYEDFEPLYTCFGTWNTTFLYCSDRFEIVEEVSEKDCEYVILRDRLSGWSFAVADMTDTDESKLPDGPVLRIDYENDEPVAVEDIALISAEDATGEVGRYLPDDLQTSRLYRLKPAQ